MDKILWIDLEMTGLDVNKEVIIEAAALVTDLQFHELATYHSVVKQPPQYLSAMDDWNQKHHRESGLYDLIPSGRSPDLVEQDLIELLNQYFPDERAVLAGNSIGQDRLFLDRHMPGFASKLHYRMLDVTSFKVVFNSLYNLKYEKKNAHRALDDIRESVAELQFYLSFVRP